MDYLKRFVIERDVSGIGSMSQVELCGPALASNQAIKTIGATIQWEHSYVVQDKTYCIYLAKDEETIRKHAELSGIPVGNISEVMTIMDPLTANN